MVTPRSAHLRSLLLLAVLLVGIAAQAFAMPLMPAGAKPVVAASMAATGDCPRCPVGDTMVPAGSCLMMFCPGLPAIAAQGPALATPTKAAYAPVAHALGAGVALGPDPGPPKPTDHR